MPPVFLGDHIYDHNYCCLADGFYAEWLAHIETLRTRFPEDAVFYIGHGGLVRPEMWDWQRGHIELFIEAVSNADPLLANFGVKATGRKPPGNGFRVFSPFQAPGICDRLPPVATAGLHKRSILGCLIWLRGRSCAEFVARLSSAATLREACRSPTRGRMGR